MKRKRLLSVSAVVLGIIVWAALSYSFLNRGAQEKSADYASALGKDTFPIGIFWQPSPQNTTNDKYKEPKDMNVNFIVGTNGIDNMDTTDAALEQIQANGMKLLVSDYQFRELPGDDIVDSLVEHYKNHPAVLGYHLYDEPTTKEIIKLDDMTEQIKSKDPDSLVYVNLFPNYSSTIQLFKEKSLARSELRPDQSLGQTFRTMKYESHISAIQLGMFAEDWGADEELKLTLWDSPKKSKLISEQSRAGAGKGSDLMLFTLDAEVKPDTMYYFELTHQGGGDNIVNRVYHSKPGEKWYPGGSGYMNGEPMDADLWFTINQNIEGLSYDDYVYRWLRTGPEVLVFDNYPFREDRNAEIPYSYYTNLEIIRSQSLAASTDFWTYIQSVGLVGMLRAPVPDEVRFHVYSNLAYGAKGYIYFTYETPVGQGTSDFHGGIILKDGAQSPLYETAKQLNSEVLNLGPALLSLTSQEVYHTGDMPIDTVELPESFFWQPVDPDAQLIIGYFLNKEGRKYIMVVNRDWRQSDTVQFHIDGNPKTVNELSKLTGEETDTDYDPATGMVSAELAAGEGRLYVLPKGF